MIPRERVMQALNFKPTDRIPKDLGGMRSTGISCFTYPRLVAALGLPPRPTRIHDLGQMLALPDLDVLDALGCDVVAVEEDITNAFDQPGLWKEYDFGGRLDALVRDPAAFRIENDGSIFVGNMRMPPSGYNFNSEHAGQLLVLDVELPKPDLKKVRENVEKKALKDVDVVRIAEHCRRVRESTDRAVLFGGPLSLGICIHGFDGLAVFPVLCLLEPELVRELHGIILEGALRNVRALLPEIKRNVDIVTLDGDDWGNQNALMAPPKVYKDLFLPFRKKHCDAIHAIAPEVKTFLHSCGAIYDILDMLVESGIDIVNPVQWRAGGRTIREWKDKCRGRMAMWGGGLNSQVTLPLGSVADVEFEVKQNIGILSQDSGFVFANIHNILAEIAPEKVIAMYRAASGGAGSERKRKSRR